VVSQLVARADGFAASTTTDFAEAIMDEEAARRAALEEEAADDSSPIAPQRFAREVAEFFGPNSIVAVDGGDIVSTTARWLQVSHPGHVLDPGPFGSLGTGPAYAIAAKVAFPDARVGIVFGDGGFGFHGMEYDTMVRLGISVVGVIGNDGVWSNIKTIHRMFYPERLVATDLGVRPYHAMVEGLGGYGELVTDPSEIGPALKRAEASGKPSLVNVHIAETMRMSSNYGQ
jgi:acetolactate synthase-1/2/3 large subunit